MKYLLTIALFILTSVAQAATASDQQLFDQLAQMDSLLFDNGFNDCELEVFDKIIHDDFEFYHDEGGVQNRDEFIQSMKQNICSSADRKPIRKLAAGTLKVFRMNSNGETYAAFQTGQHDFYLKEAGKDMYKTSIAKFSHLWTLEKDQWKLKRVVSFDHQTSNLLYPTEKLERELDAGYRPPLFDKEVEIKALLVQHKIPSLALGIIENGQLQQIRVFNADDKAPMNGQYDGLYNVASLTKPIVALVVLKLVNDGRWDLDGALAEYYVDQDLQDHPMLNKLSTRHVLSHQSGFPNWRYQNQDNKLTFNFEPGSQYQYSGEGFEYLRKAVEAKFGVPFETIAKQELFDPLGMTDTHFYWTDQVDQDRYQQEHDANGTPIAIEKHTTANAADNLITSVEDFSQFMQHILNGADLSPELYQQMLTTQVTTKSDIGFALGWQRFDNLQAPSVSGNEYALQHTGSDSGTNALAIMLPNSKRGLVVLSNSDNATKLWTKIVAEHFGDIGNQLMSANFR